LFDRTKRQIALTPAGEVFLDHAREVKLAARRAQSSTEEYRGGRCGVCPCGGFPAVVVSLVAYHTGAAFEARERGLSDALAEFPEPPELLLDVLTCADMTTGPDGSFVRAEDRVSEILSRYPGDDPVHRAIERSAPTLLAAVACVDALVAG
jgi:hypothetical protein